MMKIDEDCVMDENNLEINEVETINTSFDENSRLQFKNTNSREEIAITNIDTSNRKRARWQIKKTGEKPDWINLYKHDSDSQFEETYSNSEIGNSFYLPLIHMLDKDNCKWQVEDEYTNEVIDKNVDAPKKRRVRWQIKDSYSNNQIGNIVDWIKFEKPEKKNFGWQLEDSDSDDGIEKSTDFNSVDTMNDTCPNVDSILEKKHCRWQVKNSCLKNEISYNVDVNKINISDKKNCRWQIKDTYSNEIIDSKVATATVEKTTNKSKIAEKTNQVKQKSTCGIQGCEWDTVNGKQAKIMAMKYNIKKHTPQKQTRRRTARERNNNRKNEFEEENTSDDDNSTNNSELDIEDTNVDIDLDK